MIRNDTNNYCLSALYFISKNRQWHVQNMVIASNCIETTPQSILTIFKYCQNFTTKNTNIDVIHCHR